MKQTLHCQNGNHEWKRDLKRGRVPLNCPKHKVVVPKKSFKEEARLALATGGLSLLVTPKPKRVTNKEISEDVDAFFKGSKTPKAEPITQPQKISGTKRAQAIEEILADRFACTCDIRPDMTDDELMYEVKSCTPAWQCSILCRVRDRVVNYARHSPKEAA